MSLLATVETTIQFRYEPNPIFLCHSIELKEKKRAKSNAKKAKIKLARQTIFDAIIGTYSQLNQHLGWKTFAPTIHTQKYDILRYINRQ